MRAGVTELRNIRHAARKRHLANAAQTTSGGRGRRHLANAYETPSGGLVITASVGILFCTNLPANNRVINKVQQKSMYRVVLSRVVFSAPGKTTVKFAPTAWGSNRGIMTELLVANRHSVCTEHSAERKPQLRQDYIPDRV